MARRWTLLVFMAADNDLDRYAVKDIHEMERLGSNEEVALIVQIDRRSDGLDGQARRGLVTKNPNWQRFNPEISSALTPLEETNTGDPKVLADFIVWGATTFPADNYGLIVWNHGSGWKPDFIYEAAEKSAGSDVAFAMRDADFSRRFLTQTRRLVFRRTLDEKIDSFIKNSLLPELSDSAPFQPLAHEDRVGRFATLATRNDFSDIMLRAIALDETSHDALDCIELNSALTSAVAQIQTAGRPAFRFAFVGFDACLMMGVEVAFQIRGVADAVIGSEEIEPAVGWRYDLLLETTTLPSPGLSSDGYITSVVENYITGLADYGIRLVTQSALRTTTVELLAAKLNELSEKLIGLVDSSYGKLAQAEKTSTRFFDTDFLDIGDYLAKIANASTDPVFLAVVNAANVAYQSTIIASRFAFPRPKQQPTGLSVYYPTKPTYDPAYNALGFHLSMPGWSEFVRRYHFLTS